VFAYDVETVWLKPLYEVLKSLITLSLTFLGSKWRCASLCWIFLCRMKELLKLEKSIGCDIVLRFYWCGCGSWSFLLLRLSFFIVHHGQKLLLKSRLCHIHGCFRWLSVTRSLLSIHHIWQHLLERVRIRWWRNRFFSLSHHQLCQEESLLHRLVLHMLMILCKLFNFVVEHHGHTIKLH